VNPPAHMMTALETEAAEMITGYAGRAGAHARKQNMPREVPEGLPTRGCQRDAFLAGWDLEDSRIMGVLAHLGGET
jgi:hypothetical protein